MYLLRGTTSYVAGNALIAEQQHDIVICETPEQTTPIAEQQHDIVICESPE